jgi:hypothetical protein
MSPAEVAEWFALRAAMVATDGVDPAEPEYVDTGAVGDGSDALARIRLLDRQVAMSHGEQVLAMAEWMAGARARHLAARPVWVDPQCWQQAEESEYAERSAYAEVALELGLADRTSDARVATAVDLVERLPATVAALCAGRVTLAKARVILEETANLDPELLADLEADLLVLADGLTPGNLRRTTRRAVARIDAAAATKRRAAALAERSVRVWDLGDGMSALHAVLPSAAAEAVFAVIDATAQAAMVPGDTRGIDAARADALVDLICFPPEISPRVGYRIQIISPDPDLDADPTRRLPNAAQARWIRARDQHCVHPGCRATRTEDDHTIAWSTGGPTLTTNLARRCPKHHALKHLPGWSATQGPDGTLTLTTPSGRTYRTRPPDPDGIDLPVEKLPPPKPRPPDLPQHPRF